MKNNIQHAIDQIGYDAVRKSIGDIAMGSCSVHGHYTYDRYNGTKLCPICPKPNGDTASEVEHYININELINPASGANPGQVINPTGISEQDIKNAKADLDRA